MRADTDYYGESTFPNYKSPCFHLPPMIYIYQCHITRVKAN